MNREAWSAKLGDEARHWREVIQTGGGAYAEDWAARFDPKTDLQNEIRALLPDEPIVRILDVGAGPATTVGKIWPGHHVMVTPIDPLAIVYGAELGRRGLFPPVLTTLGEAEQLAADYAPDSFDLVYSRNAIDHGHDPIAAISGMLYVAPLAYLVQSVREGSANGYAGLHRWDFWVEEGALMLEGDGERVDVGRRLGANVETRVDGRWIHAVLRRNT